METKGYSFVGDFESRADAKNRIVLPAAFKREFEGEGVTVVVKKDLYEKCLDVYPADVWEAMMTDLRNRIDPYNRQHAQFLREFQRNTSEISLDANGRLLIPQRLIDLIGAGKEMIFLGVGDHLELWDKAVYEGATLTEDQLSLLAEDLFGKK